MNAADMMPLTHSHDGARPIGRTFPVDDVEIFRTARTDVCVLFTGRAHAEMLALHIHNLSGWRWGRFVSIDCGWSEQQLEKKLFGLLESDDPAPAEAAQPRLLQAGTLFLHEVGTLNLALQGRLADALEAGSARGGRRARWRVMASASQPLLGRVVDGTFDDRLYYRLNAIHHVVGR